MANARKATKSRIRSRPIQERGGSHAAASSAAAAAEAEAGAAPATAARGAAENGVDDEMAASAANQRPRVRRGAVSAAVVTEEDAVSYVKKVRTLHGRGRVGGVLCYPPRGALGHSEGL